MQQISEGALSCLKLKKDEKDLFDLKSSFRFQDI